MPKHSQTSGGLKAAWVASALVVLGVLTPASSRAALFPPDEAQAEQVESRCKINGEEFNLTGKALDASIKACVSQESPDLAYWENCRTRGRHKGFNGAAMQDFVAYCLSRQP